MERVKMWDGTGKDFELLYKTLLLSISIYDIRLQYPVLEESRTGCYKIGNECPFRISFPAPAIHIHYSFPFSSFLNFLLV